MNLHKRQLPDSDSNSSDLFEISFKISNSHDKNPNKAFEWRAPYVHEPITDFGNLYKKNDVINGQYEVIDIFSGSMGTVFHCYDRTANIEVAIKTLIDFRKTDRSRVYSFFDEAVKRVQLSPHRNIVKFRLVEQIHGYPYIVSQWIAGHTVYGNSLESWMKNHIFTPEEIVSFLQQICAGLLHCSRQLSTDKQPFVLGDLKPENILINDEQIYMLADFSTHCYTPGWESPEQARHEPLDERSDIYTLGLIARQLFESATQSSKNKHLVESLEKLIRTCTEPELKNRMPSLQALETSLNSLCKKFNLPLYSSKDSQLQQSFLDYMYVQYSEINLGMPLRTSNSLLDQSMFMSRQKFVDGVKEFAEYAKHPDRITYEAELALRSGNIQKARGIFAKYESYFKSPPHKTARYFYVRGMMHIYSNEMKEGLQDLDAASSEELYLPALNAKADFFIHNPHLLNSPLYKNDIKKTLDRIFKNYLNDSDGFFSNQIYGKYLMLMNEYALASRAFQESLFFPNADEWNNLYYYGVCEYRQNNLYKAHAVFYSTTQVIESDTNYLSNYQKAVTLLYCWNALANEEKTAETAAAIKEFHHISYQTMVDSLHRDHMAYKTWIDTVMQAEKQLIKDPAALQKRLHELMNTFLLERPIENALLLGNVLNTLSTRETALLFSQKRYTEASESCDKALMHDGCHPIILKNKGACLHMAGDYSTAQDCYRLSAYYEQDTEISRNTLELAKKIQENSAKSSPSSVT